MVEYFEILPPQDQQQIPVNQTRELAKMKLKGHTILLQDRAMYLSGIIKNKSTFQTIMSNRLFDLHITYRKCNNYNIITSNCMLWSKINDKSHES